MPCNCTDYDTNCQPCGCPEPTPPVLPRCEHIVLASGTYTNATITVNDIGCITNIQSGTPFVYQADPCCGSPSSGGGGYQPCDCPPGEPGKNASIRIGTVTTLPAGTNATVYNAGTATEAVLNFGIPRGDQGETGQSQSGVSSNLAGIEIERGTITSLPAQWPPIMVLEQSAESTTGVHVTFSKDDERGIVTALFNLGDYTQRERQQTNSDIAVVQAALTAAVQRIAQLESRMTAAEGRITTIQNTCCN